MRAQHSKLYIKYKYHDLNLQIYSFRLHTSNSAWVVALSHKIGKGFLLCGQSVQCTLYTVHLYTVHCTLYVHG